MIIWSGHGILIAVAAVSGVVGASIFFGLIEPLQNYIIAGTAWGAALMVLLYAKTIGKTKETVLIDPKTRQNVVHRSSHSLFFIPAKAWSVLFIIGAVLMTVFNFMIPDSAFDGESDQQIPGMAAFSDADSSIGSNSDGAAKGNSDEAILLATDFSELLKDLRSLGVEEDKRKRAISLSGGEFVTYCHLTEDECVFLVHVPALRKFTDGAKEFISEAAWIAGTTVLAKNGETVSKLGIGVKGVVLYSSVWIGAPSMNLEEISVKEKGVLAKNLLYPFFTEKSPNAVGAVDPDDIIESSVPVSKTEEPEPEPEPEPNFSISESTEMKVLESTLPTEIRDWNSADGKTLRASLKSISEDGLSGEFVREDGQKFTISKERLGEEDRAFFERLANPGGGN